MTAIKVLGMSGSDDLCLESGSVGGSSWALTWFCFGVLVKGGGHSHKTKCDLKEE